MKIPSEIVPIVKEAQKAMRCTISLQDIVYIWSLGATPGASPPTVVQDVVQTALLLLGHPDNMPWAAMRAVMGNNCKRFFKSLIRLTYNIECIKSAAVWRRVHSMCSDATMHPWLIKRACAEASKLCDWVRTVSNYQKMIKIIKKETGLKKIINFKVPERKVLRSAKKKRRIVRRKASSRSKPLAMSAQPNTTAEEYLAAAMPLLDEANNALGELTKDTIIEIQSLRRPPLIVKQVAYACLILFGVKKSGRTWEKALKVIRDKKLPLLEKIRSFPRERLSLKCIRAFERYVEKNEIDSLFVKNASLPAAKLCKWAEKTVVLAKVHREFLRRYK